ncbi:hypothetical protein [Sphingopyxis sp. BSNA05]|uniref:hypothetical protein n=1 Tax=Sphingopyxis sp. BSNA05 TaxID=1236614 RepID=UPI001C278897|nr:hypothetical protein [Sphingopyxis sp. BSNA05]
MRVTARKRARIGERYSLANPDGLLQIIRNEYFLENIIADHWRSFADYTYAS